MFLWSEPAIKMYYKTNSSMYCRPASSVVQQVVLEVILDKSKPLGPLVHLYAARTAPPMFSAVCMTKL